MIIAGTLELSSKVRYGMSSRGVPSFRFIPYDKRFSPMAVGCSQRDLFYNVHAIVEPQTHANTDSKGLQKANLLTNLGVPTPQTEQEVLLTTYAYDSQKNLKTKRKEPLVFHQPDLSTRVEIKEGFTFHIDPPGCKDVDDSFTFCEKGGVWHISIHIADVAEWIPEGSPLDLEAMQRATTFYSPVGEALSPMLPRELSEEKASLGSSGLKPTLTLSFVWRGKGHKPETFEWLLTASTVQKSFTYDEALASLGTSPELQALADLTEELGGNKLDSHSWVQELMLLYNKQAGTLLKSVERGLLRRHAPSKAEKLTSLQPLLHKYPELALLAFESAEYCLPTEHNTNHFGIQTDAYAYASSPLRRYADLVNQRVLKAVLAKRETVPCSSELVFELNRREKQAKAFSRDLFFSTSLTSSGSSVKGIILNESRVFVPSWKRAIRVKCLNALPSPGSEVSVEWFEDRSQARWKERMVFSVKQTEE